MTMLDRAIIRRFLINFAILFALIYLLASSIDFILQLDEFMKAVQASIGAEAGLPATLLELGRLSATFYGPRAFQAYAYFLGLVSVGAMGFTLAQMIRHRELVAILASGVSLHRVAWPMIVAAFGLNLIQLVNSNAILPRLAPQLIRDHGDLAEDSVGRFSIPLTVDSRGLRLHSPEFDRSRETLASPTFIEPDAIGRGTRRITAKSATWDEVSQAWRLDGGRMIVPTLDENGEVVSIETEPMESVATDLSPRVLVVRRYKAFAQMLSPSQIEELMAGGAVVDAAFLARVKYARYSTVFSNMLLLIIALPFFLIRQPVNLLRRSAACAAVSLPLMLGAFVGMEVEFEALPPVVAVFLPVIVMIPLAFAGATWVRT